MNGYGAQVIEGRLDGEREGRGRDGAGGARGRTK